MAATPAAPDALARPQSQFGGIATRAVALAIDTAIVWVTLLVVGGVLALVGSLVGGTHLGPLAKVAVGTVGLVAAGLYFVVCWTAAGRTVGQRMMELRVVDPRGEPPHFIRSVIRVVMMGLCILIMFLGFLPVLFDRRRRGLHDMVAHTTVRYGRDEEPDVAAPVAAAEPVRFAEPQAPTP